MRRFLNNDAKPSLQQLRGVRCNDGRKEKWISKSVTSNVFESVLTRNERNAFFARLGLSAHPDQRSQFLRNAATKR